MKNFVEVIKICFQLVSSRGKYSFYKYTFALLVIAAIDSAAIVILANTLVTISGRTAQAIFSLEGLGPFIAVVLLFLTKSALSSTIYYKFGFSLAQEEVDIGKNALNTLNALSWGKRSSVKRSEYIKLLDQAPAAITQGVISNFAQVVPELFSVFGMLIVLLALKPLIAITALLFFLNVAAIQHRVISRAISKSGEETNRSSSKVHGLLLDGRELGKVLSVIESKSYSDVLDKARKALSFARAKVAFFSFLPGYLTEATIAFGFLIIGGVSLIFEGPYGVFSSLALFAASGLRLLPAINRVQVSAMRIGSQESLIREFKTKISDFGSFKDQTRVNYPTEGFLAANSKVAIDLVGISFSHEKALKPAVDNVSLRLEFGKTYAIVGASGAGKTTLVDIILGLHKQSSGSIRKNKRLRVSYVPQDSFLFSGDLDQNIALEWDSSKIDTRATSRLSRLFATGIKQSGIVSGYNIQETLSGGQKQRIGIARAFYRKSNFIVFDEATSSLDANLEKDLMGILSKNQGKKTLLFIAHRISTIRHADTIFFMSQGRVIAEGNFEYLDKNCLPFHRMVENSKI